jgi:hypothetical protein
VYVSTLPLLDAWLADPVRGKPPADVAAAFKSPGFYTQAIGPAAATIFGELPLAARPGIHPATALLLTFAQDEPAPNPPDELVVAFVRDGRVILFVRSLKLAQIPSCKSAWDRENKASQDVLDAYQKSGARDQAMFSRYNRLDGAANDNFVRCFGERFRSSADYTATVGQAQALLDRASGR